MKKKAGANEASPRAHGLILRSKSAQLCEFLRAELSAGRVPSPPPGMRRWSQELGVSRRTLYLALQEMQTEGWLKVGRRGAQLADRADGEIKSARNAPRLVHLLLEVAYQMQISNYFPTISMLQTQLPVHGIQFRWEICPPARMREIARRAASGPELLVLASLSPVYQRLFAESGKPALVLGQVAPGLTLPFVNADQSGAVRHATFKLLQRGFERVSLIHLDAPASGIKSAVESFQSAAAGWPRQPVTTRLIPCKLDQRSLTLSAQRLARNVRGREGFIVLAPVPLGIVITALLQHGIAVPRQADVISLFHGTEAITLFPPPTSYPSPITAIVKQLVKSATHFFAHGSLPPTGKIIPVEVARES